MNDTAAAVIPHPLRNPCWIRKPASGGPVICATEVSDCVSPSTTPCSSRGVACVIMLVSVGRTRLPERRHRRRQNQHRNRITEREQQVSRRIRRESHSIQHRLAKPLAPFVPARTLQKNPQESRQRPGVAHLLRSELHAVPESRRSANSGNPAVNIAKGNPKRNKLTQPPGQFRPLEIASIFAPLQQR